MEKKKKHDYHAPDLLEKIPYNIFPSFVIALVVYIMQVYLFFSYFFQSCNTLACGFDGGDCGLEKVDLLHQFPVPTTSNVTYLLPRGNCCVHFTTDISWPCVDVTGAQCRYIWEYSFALVSS